MTIEIKIIDPHSETPERLKFLADFLTSINSAVKKPLSMFTEEELKPIGYSDYGAPEINPKEIFARKPQIDTVVPPAMVVSSRHANTELDSAGNAWDAKIHSRTKSKRHDGTWKLQRGLDVRTLVDASPISPSPRKPSLPNVPLPPPMISPPPTAEVIAGETFATVMNKIVTANTAGKLTKLQVTEILNKFGVASLPLLGARPEVLADVSAEIDKVVNND